MHKKYLFMFFLIAFSYMSFAEIVVVTHKDNANTLTKKNISRIFLGKDKNFPDGSEATPVNQKKGSDVQDTFNESVLGRSTSQVAAFWARLVFTGKGIPPKEVSDDAAMIDLISKNQSAIGYVNKSAVTDAVKVITF